MLVRILPTMGLMVLAALATPATAAEPLKLGGLELTVPEGWTAKEPASRIIAYEFAIPAAEGDKLPGRLTVSVVGGSIDANLERWYGQFTQPDNSATADKAKVETVDVQGVETRFVDISGTFMDRPSPREQGVKREGYRLLGAILSTEDGTYYLKFYGPERTVAAQEKAFRAMVTEAKKP